MPNTLHTPPATPLQIDALDTLAEALNTKGFAVLTHYLSEEQSAIARKLALAHVRPDDPRVDEHPRPLRSTDPGPHVHVTRTGLVVDRLLLTHDEVRAWTFRSELIRAVRHALGPDMRLEREAAIVVDRSRAFFRWHTHIDGADEGERAAANHWPQKERVERIVMLLYLDWLDDDSGPLLLYPRAAGTDTAPPFDVQQREWPGHVRLRTPPGTLVLLDECTWHAVPAMRRDGDRVLIGAYFAADVAQRPPWTDEAVAHLID